MANFEIYKRGQGIYVRLGTAAGAALILALTIYWVCKTVLGTLQPSSMVATTQQAAAGFNWSANWMYVQAAAGLLVGILGAFFTFKLLNNPKFTEFQIMTESEMRKVTWPSRKEIIRSTQVIIFMTFLFAGILWMVDLGFVWFFQLIGIITKGPS